LRRRSSGLFFPEEEESMTSVPRRHRFTVEEYYQVADRGLARGGAKVELIDGAIFDMTPQGPWHVECVRLLSEMLIRGVRARERVYVQSTLRLGQWSAPEPDIVVTRGGSKRWALPQVSDILLVIEVADTTIDYDLGTKVPLYERVGIPEVWVVDREARQVHVFRQSGAEPGYGPADIVRPPDRLSSCGVPVDLGSLFP
jgi:Uma2 family endonuclease